MYCIVGTGGIASYRISTFQSFVLDMELPDISGWTSLCGYGRKTRGHDIIVNTMHEEIWFIKDLIQSAVDGILFKSIDLRK